jgi:hypothetical protein
MAHTLARVPAFWIAGSAVLGTAQMTSYSAASASAGKIPKPTNALRGFTKILYLCIVLGDIAETYTVSRFQDYLMPRLDCNPMSGSQVLRSALR